MSNYTLQLEETPIVYNLFLEETVVNYTLSVDDEENYDIQLENEICGCFDECPFGVLSVSGDLPEYINNTDPRNPIIQFQAIINLINSLVESDPVFGGWLATNPLNGLITETAANLLYYPLNTNPAGYVVGQEVEEYTNFASFPLSGDSGIIYIALDSGLFYSWNGLNYISSSPPASLTKLQQSYNASPNGKILLSLANGPLDLQPAHASINYTLLSRNLAGVIQGGIFPNGTFFGTVMDASTHQGGTGVAFQENFGVVRMIANRTGTLSTNRWDVHSRMQYNADYSAYFNARSLVDKGYIDNSSITIATAVSITTLTLDANGLGQHGRDTAIDNGANAINISTDITSEANFTASYLKHGAAAITFVQGAGTTLVQVDGTASFNGAVGSTATLRRVGNTFYLRISNV